MFWYEHGGNKIGRLYIEGPEADEFPKWRLIGKYKNEFPPHMTIVFINHGPVTMAQPEPSANKNIATFFLLGGIGNNCCQYIDKNIVNKAPMLQEKSFFPAVAIKGQTIFTFGGYENIEKIQLKTCEFYNIDKDQWQSNHGVELNEARSQAAAAHLSDTVIFIFGGYNKEAGTLSSIERFDIRDKKISLIEMKMPCPLRRFAAVKISVSKILLLGGVQRLSKDSDTVYCFDVVDGIKEDGQVAKPAASWGYSVENLDKIDKAGVIDYPVLVDSIGNLHLFLENASGTSPPLRSVYSFLEYS